MRSKRFQKKSVFHKSPSNGLLWIRFEMYKKVSIYWIIFKAESQLAFVTIYYLLDAIGYQNVFQKRLLFDIANIMTKVRKGKHILVHDNYVYRSQCNRDRRELSDSNISEQCCQLHALAQLGWSGDFCDRRTNELSQN